MFSKKKIILAIKSVWDLYFSRFFKINRPVFCVGFRGYCKKTDIRLKTTSDYPYKSQLGAHRPSNSVFLRWHRVFWGVWQTHNFNVFAHKLGNQRGIYFFLKLPVWVKIIRNLVVFQPKNPKKVNFFQKFRNLKFDDFFFESREFFYSSKWKKKMFFFWSGP